MCWEFKPRKWNPAETYMLTEWCLGKDWWCWLCMWHRISAILGWSLMHRYVLVCLFVCFVLLSVRLPPVPFFLTPHLPSPPLPTKGCDSGTYLSINVTCLPCPANSNSTQHGLSVCPCLEGYFRAVGESPERECTRKYDVDAWTSKFKLFTRRKFFSETKKD